jgi:hypothetical protein
VTGTQLKILYTKKNHSEAVFRWLQDNQKCLLLGLEASRKDVLVHWDLPPSIQLCWCPWGPCAHASCSIRHGWHPLEVIYSTAQVSAPHQGRGNINQYIPPPAMTLSMATDRMDKALVAKSKGTHVVMNPPTTEQAQGKHSAFWATGRAERCWLHIP